MKSELEVNSCPQSVDNLWITMVNSWINARYWLFLSISLVVRPTYPQLTHKQERERFTLTTWGFTCFPQQTRLVTTNTYI
jgi:hypothetical protein